jgi:putative hydrolase of the HAD superfamily
MTEAVLFDLDETLTDRGASVRRYAARLRSDLAAELRNVIDDELARVITVADAGGYAPRPEVFTALQNQIDWPKAVSVSELADHWNVHFPRSAVARPGVASTFDALRSRGYKLGVVTNGVSRRQTAKLETLGLADHLAALVISEDVGVKKPAAEIFLRALRALGCACGASWFVGDHPANDVDGARRVGMRGVWLRGVHEWPTALEPAEYRIDAIPETLAVVDR